MCEVEQKVCEKIRGLAKGIVKYSVSKSFFIFGHELEIPEEVRKWAVEEKSKRGGL